MSRSGPIPVPPWDDPSPPRWRWSRVRAPEPLPVRPHRRRLYILPSAFGLTLILALMGLVLHALQHRSSVAAAVFLLLDLSLIVALVRTHRLLTGIAVQAVQLAPAYAGEPLSMQVNLAWMRRWGSARVRLHWGPTQVPVVLRAGHVHSVRLTRTAPGRGVHRLGHLLIDSRHPSGIARAMAWIWPDQEVCIYPKPVSTAVPLESLGQRATGRFAPHADDEPYQLRAHRAGDPLNRIAWKVSAKRGQWMVLDHRSAHQGGPLTLDWQAVDGDTERRCSVLARAVLDAERMQRAYRLVLPHRTVPLGRGPHHRHGCLRALAEVPAHA